MGFEFKKRTEEPFVIACATATQEGCRVAIGEIVTDEVFKLAANLDEALTLVVSVIQERTGLQESTILSIIAGTKRKQAVLSNTTFERIKAVRNGR
jgi:hypothetical protein